MSGLCLIGWGLDGMVVWVVWSACDIIEKTWRMYLMMGLMVSWCSGLNLDLGFGIE